MVGNYLYFKHTRDKIADVRQRLAPQDLYPALHQIGGVHSWAITVGIAVGIILVVIFSVFFAAISTFMLGMIR